MVQKQKKSMRPPRLEQIWKENRIQERAMRTIAEMEAGESETVTHPYV